MNGSFYGFDPNQQAAKRVLATYTYRLDNQLASLNYKWQDQGQADKEITTALYTYNPSQFHLRSGMELDAHPTNYPTGYNYTESYTYHPTLDYLTGVDYSDGTAWDKTWTYDVAGNRNDSTVDMLNRQLSSPGFTYSHDAVGNRTYKKINNVNRFGYSWDQFNRLDAYAELDYQSGGMTMVGAGVANYDYLPNGLRSTKLIDSNIDLEELDANGNPILSGYYDENTLQNDSTTRYRYDGQMTMEEDVTYASGGGTVVDETRYLLGARGIERLEAQRMASPQSNDPLKTAKRSYPLYDGHGNMIATLGRTATGYTVANEKKYDVWGAVRASQSPGSHVVNPNKEYCANLGHTFDGESDLIYMRARYYEPATGRFISEDPARDMHNWFTYAGSAPTVNVGPDGLFRWLVVDTLFAAFKKYMPDHSPLPRAVTAIADNVLSGISSLKAVIYAGSVTKARVRAAGIGLAQGMSFIHFTAAIQQFAVASLLMLIDASGADIRWLQNAWEEQARIKVL